MTTIDILKKTKDAYNDINMLNTDEKNKVLIAMSDEIKACTDDILKANEEDVKASTGIISDVMIDRLKLDKKRITDMCDGIIKVTQLEDPVGKVLSSYIQPNGLEISKVSVPVGLIAIIYESRPNVTSDAAALAVKSGNTCVLRCGQNSFKTSKAIICAMKKGIEKCKVNPDIINIVEDSSRQSSYEIMNAKGIVDLLIPRGGKGLIKACTENATVPCIETGTGICHIYVDETADIDKAVDIIDNAKTSRPSVCNAEEVLLVNSAVADEFLPKVKQRLQEGRTNPVELRLDERAAKIIDGTLATEEDFNTEFLDYILAVKIVDNADEAIKHINSHSTGHSESIITKNSDNADKFTKLIDSAAVYVNASTRFTDGGEFGLGCEMGISTQKLHARGPMGLFELNTYKYVIKGNGQIR
ncbi:MAG: glutamate-5-semialdehyde dehydrogenase [Clostridia bacterium]|nr:glutamate-5-semialdehyde dehydrogenase [Clostridia bacterium]